MRKTPPRQLALSIYITARGYAFVLFEGSLQAVDWGTKEVSGSKKQECCIEGVCKLLARHRPECVVIEEWRAKRSKRAARIRKLYRSIEDLAKSHNLPVARYRRREVLECFRCLDAHTKQERALLIANHVKALAYKVPPKRQLWTSEHPRMGLFEAASLNFTHFQNETP